MRKIIWLMAVGCALQANARSLADDIEQLVKKTIPNASTGMLFQRCDSSDVIYQKNINKLYAPASVTKLFTTTAGLKQLGSNYHYETNLYKKGNDYYLKFTGDPTLTDDDVKEIVSTIDTSKPVRLHIDNTRFSGSDYPEGLSYEDLGWYYAAPIQSVIINENAIRYRLNTKRAASRKPLIQPVNKQEKNYLTIQNKVTIVGSKHKHICGLHLRPHDNNMIEVYGCLQKQRYPYIETFAIPNPALLAKTIIGGEAKKKHLNIEKPIDQQKTPADAMLVTRHQSETLLDIVTTLMQKSNNTYANSLIKTIAFEDAGAGNFEQGTRSVQTILHDYADLDSKSYHLSDGAGNRFNLITPAVTVSLLQQIHGDKPMMANVSKTLPRAGESGSLKYRLRSTSLKGKVLAKTGSMHDTVSLAGYLYPKDKQCVAFAMLSNNVDISVRDVKRMEDKILLMVAKSLQ